MSKIRAAIVGAGNCASALVQGVEFYRDADPGQTIPGLMHPELGGYHIGDIEFAAAFDVDAAKVGQDLSKALKSGENNTIEFAEVPHLDVTVKRGPTLDGIGSYVADLVEESLEEEVGRSRGAAKGRGGRGDLLPAGRVAAGHRVLRGAGAGSRVRFRKLHSRVHRPQREMGRAVPGGGVAHRGRRPSNRRWAPPSCIAAW